MSLLGLLWVFRCLVVFGAVVGVLALGVVEVRDVVEVVGVKWLAVALGQKIGNMVVVGARLVGLVVVVVAVVAGAAELADVV